uniref:Acyl-coenzyme A oxidase n=1 Tax=Caenorhabditis japonica TaxID=281687 RepID=A0A8R1HSI3_CAEJA
MPLNKYIQDGDNQDLTNERFKATFDTEHLATVYHGGEEKLKKLRHIRNEITKRGHLFDSIPSAHRTRAEKIEDVSRKLKNLMETVSDFADVTDNLDMVAIIRDVMGVDGFPLALHTLMFVPTLQNQADDEQIEEWLMEAIQGKIIGTYAQTELGHGTNLSAIETTATFDKSTDEFVIHTPTTTATKWWPGGLGTSCTHVVLVANLIIDLKNYGLHPFFVPIRDRNTYLPLSGISVGDIGSKMGVNCVDNGFLAFVNYRIPRRNMLMKHSKVSKDGSYTAPPHPKAAYTTMLYVRSELILHQSCYLAMAMAISIRYSAVRRQGEIKAGTQEVQILDYQTQQYRLFPGLARVFAYVTAAATVSAMTESCIKDLSHGNSDVLADLHALSCGLKAVVTHQASQSIDQARQACGGHGYSDASYLPSLYTSSVGACTYEGENMVMLLQLARYLMKAATKKDEGAALTPLVAYLGGKSDQISTGNDKFAKLLSHFEHIARRRVMHAYRQMIEEEQHGVERDYAFANHSVDWAKAARAHTKLFIANGFAARVQTISDDAVRDVFTTLVELYLCYELMEMAADLTADGYLSEADVQQLRVQIYESLKKIRPNAVSIVDSFDLCDRELRSVLGRRDGHVYENLYKWAQLSPLNQKNLPHVEKYLKPMTSKL